MKIKTVTVSVSETVNLGDYGSLQFKTEYMAEVEAGETGVGVKDILAKQAKKDVFMEVNNALANVKKLPKYEAIKNVKKEDPQTGEESPVTKDPSNNAYSNYGQQLLIEDEGNGDYV